MKIEHIAIWVKDLEKMREFYTHYFGMNCNEMYVNEKKKFSSYFLSFETGARIEIMHKADVSEQHGACLEKFGLAHFAISVGDRQTVDYLTEDLKRNGFRILGPPRVTGDGYYESVVLDPEGNNVEITE